MAEADWRGLVCEWFPELADARLRQVSWPVIECHRDYIAEQLKAGVTTATVYQRLVDEHGLTASVASLRRWVRANLPEEARRARVTVLRDTPPAGREAQIDYGKLGMWFDPRSGRRRTVWAFVMVLAHSRHMFVHPTLVMDQAEWTAAHVEAFAFFGGVPARLVPDNLRTGVDRPDLYDPKINRSYAELAAHYGALVDPARAFKPRTNLRLHTAPLRVDGLVVYVCAGRCLGWAAGLGAVERVVGVGWVVEHFVFVVVALAADKSGAVPGFDGRGGHAELGGHFGEGD